MSVFLFTYEHCNSVMDYPLFTKLTSTYKITPFIVMKATEIGCIDLVYIFRTHDQQLGHSGGKNAHHIVRVFILSAKTKSSHQKVTYISSREDCSDFYTH